MSDAWIKRWEERFSQDEFAYGTEPNIYLKEQLEKLPPGKILFPAEGEGRNAVFAAKLGWDVIAFDISAAGKQKAFRLAQSNNVTLNYHVGGIESLDYKAGQFDALALIYAHFPADIKSLYHKALDKLLRTGGMIIFEAFSKKHLANIARNEKVGGPNDIEMLFSIEEIRNDFQNYEIIELVEKEIELKEGIYHNGIGSVIRFTGRKE
jgi:SAM-dependent methyltransferase